MSAEPLVFTDLEHPRRPVAVPLLPAPISVEILRDHREAEWDRYVRSSPGATFFHQLGWRWLVERTFGWMPRAPQPAHSAPPPAEL